MPFTIKKAGECMPMTEKELNCHLLDMVDLLDRLERVAKRVDCKPMLEEIDFERVRVNRKLYQKPPLTDN